MLLLLWSEYNREVLESTRKISYTFRKKSKKKTKDQKKNKKITNNYEKKKIT